MTTNILDFVTVATKEKSRLRLAVSGPSGSGKTYSMINILMHMGCKNVVVLDTEHGSAAKYSNKFPHKFSVIDNSYWKSNYDPRRLTEGLKKLGSSFDGIIVDSLTHFWMGPGGMLTLVDEFAKHASRNGGKYDTFGAWKKADPIYNELVQTILNLPCHFAAGLRAKADYEDVVVDGKKKKVKVGMASQMREGFEYEFDVEGMMTMDHELVIGKSRCSEIDGKTFSLPGENVAKPLLEWLTDGVDVPPVTRQMPPSERAPETVPENTVYKMLVDKLASAANETELMSIGKEISSNQKDGELTADEAAALRPMFKARAEELKKAS